MLYSHVPYHNDTIIKMQEDFFIKIFTSHFICKGTKGYSKFACERELERPNITEIFWPQTYGRQRCVFLVLHGCSTGALESTLLGAGFPYYTSSISLSNSTRLNSSVLCSIRRPYFTFKLLRGYMDTPPCLRNFFRYLAIGRCHFRYLWNGLCDRHRAETTVMQFRGYSLLLRQSMRV